MQVISSIYGTTLLFPTLESVQGVINNLIAMKTWAETDGEQPPYLYHEAHDALPEQQLHDYLCRMKGKSPTDAVEDDSDEDEGELTRANSEAYK